MRRESAAVKKSADLNTAAASLKLGNYKEAITAATKVTYICLLSLWGNLGV